MDLFLSIIITILFSILILGSIAILVFFIIEKVMKHNIKKHNLQNNDNDSGDEVKDVETIDDESKE